MSISPVNTWGVGDKLTSGQATELSTKLTYAVDKRSGQTDTIQSVVSCTNGGRVKPSYVVGTNADTTYSLSGGISIIDGASATLTANRIYTLSTTGATAPEVVTVTGHATYDITVKVGATTLLVIGAGSTGGNQSRWAEFLFNGTTWILFKSSFAPPQQRTAFTASGNYTVPPDVFKLLVLGCGAGGGGGAAGAPNTANSLTVNGQGGGGGGGALAGFAWVDVTPGQVIAVTCGAGGAAGTPGVSSGNGGDGGDTIFGTFATFRGAQGGLAGFDASGNGIYDNYASGGPPLLSLVRPPRYSSGSASALYSHLYYMRPSEGGYGGSKGGSGASTGAGSAGMPALSSATPGGTNSTIPGTGGAQGTATSSVLGGGGGGGGGASAFGNGGNGGAGSNGATGASTAGTSGSAGTAGGGGGGGGARGNSDATPVGNGGTGGAGGTGVLIVIPIR